MIDLASRIIPLIDLTLLKDDCSEQEVRELCEQSHTSFGDVACVCVQPRFTHIAKRILQGTDVNVATVCNFPSGNQPLEQTLAEIDHAILQGADEIDLVMPYQQYFMGERGEVIYYVESCRKACPAPVILKIILETGAFESQELVYAAAKDMISAGADFIKTSTGKIPAGADPESVKSILKSIKETCFIDKYMGQNVGLKISGGVRTVEQVKSYLSLAETFMGKFWVSPHTFRIGTSQLLEQLHASS